MEPIYCVDCGKEVSPEGVRREVIEAPGARVYCAACFEMRVVASEDLTDEDRAAIRRAFTVH